MLKNKSRKFKIGITPLIIGAAMYGVAALVGFLPIALKLKGIIIGSVLVFGEINILVSIVLLGKQVVKKYKSKLNPKNWFKKKETVVTEATEVNVENTTEAPHNEIQADQTTVIELKTVKKESRKHDTIKPNVN